MDHHERQRLWEKYYSGNTSALEEKELKTLLKETADADRLPEQELFYLMNQNRALTPGPNFEESLMAKIHLREPKARIFSDYRIIRKWAAVFVMSCAIVYAAIQIPGTQKISLTTQRFTQEFQLPDGSKVWLNKNSTLTYNEDFLEKRAVQFSGEGFFSIIHHPSHPFSIETEGAVTKVLGTSFSLRSYDKEDSIELIVVQGKVAFQPNEAKEIVISTNRKVVYRVSDHKSSESLASDLNAIAWKTHLLNFVHSPVSKVLNDLQRYNGVTISVQNENILNCHFSGSFENKTVEEILATLTFSLDLEYHKTDEAYLLSGNGCAPK